MKQYDVVVVGAGPAGLGAAIECGRAGASVLLVDENDRPGGQLFKQIHKFFGSGAHYAGSRGFEIGSALLREAAEAHVEICLGTRVWGIFEDGTVSACTEERSFRVRAAYMILATGAVENSLAFPGNTLPGVITAGAAQTMVNVRNVRPGKRAVVVGSGNVGLIVAYQLLQAGMEVAAIVEAAPEVSGYEVHAGKVRRAGVPILLSHTVAEARGGEELTEVVVTGVDERFQPAAGTERVIAADTLCIAVGLSPRTELAELSGCAMDWCGPLGGRIPAHNALMETSRPNVLIAGDLSGVEEASTALDEGRLAGTRAAAALGLLEGGEGEARIRTVQARIAALRSGQFGAKRQAAKDRLWSGYQIMRGDIHE